VKPYGESMLDIGPSFLPVRSIACSHPMTLSVSPHPEPLGPRSTPDDEVVGVPTSFDVQAPPHAL